MSWVSESHVLGHSHTQCQVIKPSPIVYLYYTIGRLTMSSLFCALFALFCARSHKKGLCSALRSTYILVQVLHSLSRCLFSLESLLLRRLGVVSSVLELLIEALLDDYVLELGYRALHTVIGFQFNRYHLCSCLLCFFKPYTSIIPCVKSFVKCPYAQRSAAAWYDSCTLLYTARAGWGSCSGGQPGVVVTDVCGGGLKWPNEDD